LKKWKTSDIVLASLFAALVYVVTAYFPRIPTARGYIHIGDAMVYLAASMLPLPLSAVSAGLGGFLADSLTGYAVWAPYTLVIKACLTLPFSSKSGKMLSGRNIFSCVAAFPITIGGYYLAAFFMTGDAVVPLAEVPANAVQAAGSMALYLSFAACLDKSKLKTRLAGGER